MSDIEGKVTRVGARERGRERGRCAEQRVKELGKRHRGKGIGEMAGDGKQLGERRVKARAANEFQSREGMTEIEGKAAR